MRIGIITGEYPPMQGGIGAFTHILANHLKLQGAEVFIFTSTQASANNDGIRLENTASSWGINTLRAINRWATDNALDLINLQFQTAAFGMSPWINFLPHFTAFPVVTTFHDLRHPYLFPKAGMLRDWVVMHLARRSSGVIVTNPEDFQRLTKVPVKALIPIGSNIQQALPVSFSAQAWRAKVGAKTDDYLIAYFGLFNKTKGLETLLASVAQLSDTGIPVRLVMVGGGLGSSDPTNRAYLETLKTLISELGIEPLIHWTGYLESEADVGSYLSASDLIALPFTDGASYRRGSLMAAIQYGCAIITTQPNIDITAFQNGDNMILVTPSDPKALTKALLNAWRSPELRNHLKNGVNTLKNEFDWTSISQQTLAFFEQVRKH